MNDPWQILGLDKDKASERDVKQAYARLIKIHRPDTDPEGFQRVRQAYEMALALLKNKLPSPPPAPDAAAAPPAVEHAPDSAVPPVIPFASEHAEPPPSAPPQNSPPALIEAELAVNMARAGGDNEQLAKAIANLLRVCRDLQTGQAAIKLWQDVLYRLLGGRADLVAAGIKPELFIEEMETGNPVVTHAAIGFWSSKADLESLSRLALAMLAQSARLAHEEAAQVAVRLGLELGFSHPKLASQLINLAFPHLDRRTRDTVLPQIEEQSAIGNLFLGFSQPQLEFWRARFRDPSGHWDWTNEQSQEARRYLAAKCRSDWPGFPVISRVAPKPWLERLDSSLGRRYEHSVTRRHHSERKWRFQWWMVFLILMPILRLASYIEPQKQNHGPSVTSARAVYNASDWIGKLKYNAELGDVKAQVELGDRYGSGSGVPADYREALEWYRKAAVGGSPAGQMKLAACYFAGRGTLKDDTHGVYWVRKAAAQNFPDAQEFLGICYLAGDVVPKNPAEAASLFKLSAARGLARSKFLLGSIYLRGDGVDRDPVQAVQWFRQAAEQGHAESCYRLAQCYNQGIGVSRDVPESSKWLAKAAELKYPEAVQALQMASKSDRQPGASLPPEKKIFVPVPSHGAKVYQRRAADGQSHAQLSLGDCCFHGVGVQTNLAEAVAWYKKAAENGLAEAQVRYGLCFAYGVGVSQDNQAAIQWLLKAAGQHHPKAQGLLGDFYSAGRGVAMDEVEASTWYRKAAELGFAPSQFALGSRYLSGRGVAVDMAEGIKWLQKAADQGIAEAQVYLGALYFHGKGVPQDLPEAAKRFREAAERGAPDGLLNLSVCYARGMGVSQDLVEAYKWLILAEGKGHPRAALGIKELASKMTPAQISEAQSRASAFRPEAAPRQLQIAP